MLHARRVRDKGMPSPRRTGEAFHSREHEPHRRPLPRGARGGDPAAVRLDQAPGDGQTEPGPAVTFYATVPSAGNYRLFLDFRHGDKVRTATFTVAAGPAERSPEPAASASPAQPAEPSASTAEPEDGHGDGHGG